MHWDDPEGWDGKGVGREVQDGEPGRRRGRLGEAASGGSSGAGTHNLVNLSETQDLVTVMWANEQFDPNKPDTFFEVVE